MPKNFILNTRSCPDKFHCTTNYKNSFADARIANGNNALARKVLDHFRDLKCKLRDPRALCIPDNRQSLLLPENIFQSFKNSRLLCQKNPCPKSQKPTQNEEGYYVCENVLGLNSVTAGSGALCRRNQRYSASRGRCIARFLG